MFAMNVLKTTQTEWATLVFFVPMKDRLFRFCVGCSYLKKTLTLAIYFRYILWINKNDTSEIFKSSKSRTRIAALHKL